MGYLHDVHVLVLGLGESGLAMARWCARGGALVRVWDSRDDAPNAAALRSLVPAAQWFGGTLGVEALAGVKLVLKSPGLAPHDERIAAVLQQALASGIAVQGELDLFGRALADLKAERGYAPKVIAITGTNGKTTTTAMTALLIERTGRRVAMAGNIGPTMLQTLSDALDLEPPMAAAEVLAEVEAGPPADVPSDADADRPLLAPAACEAGAHAREPVSETVADRHADDDSAPTSVDPPPPADDAPPIELAAPPPAAPVFEHLPQVWVLELSSFQLDGVNGFEPDAATVLNLSQDHLDWHGTMTAYVAAKQRVFGTRAVMVINRDDPQVEKLVPAPAVVKGRQPKPVERDVLRFGLDAPQRPGDYGLVVDGGLAWLVRALDADDTARRVKRGSVAEAEPLHIQRLMPADAMRVRGHHNVANALAALALAGAIGCPLAPMLHALRDYAGEPHRVEFIATLDGVDAFDDSKGTNVGATVAALNGLGAEKAPGRLVVILGGDGKGQDFGPLVEPVRRHARAVATIGRDAPRVEAALATTGAEMQRFETLEAATRWCFDRAVSGDAVLLSPACASFDMFHHYGHRAQVFVDEVHALVADRGGLAS